MISRALAGSSKPFRYGRILCHPRMISSSAATDTATAVEIPGPDIHEREAWAFVDSVFPVQIARWDFRHYVGIFREETLLAELKSRLSTVKTHNFRVSSLEPHQKDGGVFIRFKYDAGGKEDALQTIESDLQAEAARLGGLPSWIGWRKGSVWLVKGSPWREDMWRFATPIVKVAFEGPDVQEQDLYELFRPYGRIYDVTAPVPAPAGTLRYSRITFESLRSATIARNVMHGLTVDSKTRLRAGFELPLQAHAIRDWMSNHPRIVVPILVFLLGTLTYTVFDPIRALMIEARMLNWFNYKEFRLFKWLQANAFERFSLMSSDTNSGEHLEEVWKERKDAETTMRNYLLDMPTTVAFIHGPQGSGKSRLLETVLQETDRATLIIDCAELLKASSDTQVVGSLARQTGYWPIFTFLASMNNLIDLASVGLIGQKAGLSSSLTDQLKEILQVVGTALKGVSLSHRAAIQRQIVREHRRETEKAESARRQGKIKEGTWHDGRLDCIAGNGVMSELGIGDERLGELEADAPRNLIADVDEGAATDSEKVAEESARKQRSAEDAQAIGSLPIVIIRNFATKGGAREDLLSVLASWAASLAENQVAHVIVISDNRENAKRLAKALPSKTLNTIALSDADSSSALSFVKQKLRDANIDLDYTQAQTDYVERLGGRASDLESLIHKVRNGQPVEDAVEDIISRGVGELRKNAFGDDIEDAKGLPWTREQAWAVLKQLSKRAEVPYHDVLLDFPFKGDETALREMEHAELIAIGTHSGRPSTIRPGKPVYKYVFERLVEDPIFQATQDIAFNEKIIAGAESTVKSCEQELLTLKEIGTESRWWGGRTASSTRAGYLLNKMLAAETKIENLEKQNAQLKKVLSKGG